MLSAVDTSPNPEFAQSSAEFEGGPAKALDLRGSLSVCFWSLSVRLSVGETSYDQTHHEGAQKRFAPAYHS